MASGADIDKTRYLRLIIFCWVYAAIVLPLNVANVIMTVYQLRNDYQSNISWSWVHWHFYEVTQVPASAWSLNSYARQTFARLDMARWAAPLAGIVCFAIFSFGHEARATYRRHWMRLRGKQPVDGAPQTMDHDR